ncbi:MAG: LysM peptidoglycan-binding domain-containing protein, partial [Phycisphaerae bacterium]|nr:LysM peptidoglycan-binding domain-containing protein [Phycisphaerae bacterium]
TYRVEEGDTLSRIAAKVYGPRKEHLYTNIFDANRNQLSDASSIHVGQELVIPPLAGQTVAPAVASNSTTPTRARQVDLEGLRQFTQQPRAASRRVYVVQSGDNLTRIARKVYNDGSRDAVERLFEANKDKLPDRDSIVEGMTLKIPS